MSRKPKCPGDHRRLRAKPIRRRTRRSPGASPSDLQLGRERSRTREWLGARSAPLRVAVVPLRPIGEAGSFAQTLDLRLAGALRGLNGLEVVSVSLDAALDPGALAQAAADAGAELVLTGAVGQMGAMRIVNLQVIDVSLAGVRSQSYAEGSEDEVASSFPSLLRDVLVHETKGIAEGEVHATVRRYAGQLKYCYERSLKDDPTLAGRFEVGWTVSNPGVVSNVHVVSDSVGNRELANCVLNKVERWLFPAGVEGEMTWPFVFTSATDAPSTRVRVAPSGTQSPAP